MDEYEKQLKAWVEGKPYHAKQCCPDFSCCEPELLADEGIRKTFYEVYKSGGNTDPFMLMFLEAGIKLLTEQGKIKKKVYVAGFEYE